MPFTLAPFFVMALSVFNKFRSLPDDLESEWNDFAVAIGGVEQFSNSVLRHHQAVDTFCARRSVGCTWAEHHAIVDHSREPWTNLFDALQISAGDIGPRATRCERIHKPTPNQLLDLVRRSQPAVLTGLLDDWPAMERWTDEYILRELGHLPVTISVSEGRFDNPETPEAWGMQRTDALRGIVARPAHVPMTLSRALATIHSNSSSGKQKGGGAGTSSIATPLTAYVEYQPIDALLAASPPRGRRAGERSLSTVLSEDLRPPIPSTHKSSGSTPPSLPPNSVCHGHKAAPVLVSRGSEEIARLKEAAWLVPRKQLLWLGGGGTIGSTHFDPYENLMAVLAGSKTFHLAPPEDGPKLGGHMPMAEGSLRLEELAEEDRVDGSGNRAQGAAGGSRSTQGDIESSFLTRHRLVRSPAAVGEPLDLHHYAPVSLSQSNESFSCTAKAGEVLYTPAYWWHEVISHACKAGDGGRVAEHAGGEGWRDELAGARRSVVAVNWFYEAFYQRIFPNRSFDRSPHYLLLEQERSLEQPFPPRVPVASPGVGHSRLGDGGSDPLLTVEVDTHAASTRTKRETSFYSRLKRKQAR
jgi:hypothetical protein